MNTADLIWLDGEFVAWEDAKVHVLSHAFHYGTSVFEGERAYATDQGPAIFRHQDHLNRLEASAKLYYMDLPYTKEQLREATHELINRNGLASCYIRPLVFRGYGPMGLDPEDNPVHTLDRRVGVGGLPRRGGAEDRRPGQGVLVAAHLAAVADPALQGGRPLPELGAREDRVQARRLRRGHPARRARPRLRGHRREHLPRQGRGAAAPRRRPRASSTASAARSIIEIARDLGHTVVERDIARAEMALSDEMFLVGTAAELTPVREIDDIELGPPGPVTKEIQGVYVDALHGRAERYAKWLDVVPVPSKA